VRAVAELPVGGVGDDAIDPGSEGRIPPERIDLSDYAPESVLDDLLGIRAVPRDAAGQAIRSIAISVDKSLCCCRFALAEDRQQVPVPV